MAYLNMNRLHGIAPVSIIITTLAILVLLLRYVYRRAKLSQAAKIEEVDLESGKVATHNKSSRHTTIYLGGPEETWIEAEADSSSEEDCYVRFRSKREKKKPAMYTVELQAEFQIENGTIEPSFSICMICNRSTSTGIIASPPCGHVAHEACLERFENFRCPNCVIGSEASFTTVGALSF